MTPPPDDPQPDDPPAREGDDEVHEPSDGMTDDALDPDPELDDETVDAPDPERP